MRPAPPEGDGPEVYFTPVLVYVPLAGSFSNFENTSWNTCQDSTQMKLRKSNSGGCNERKLTLMAASQDGVLTLRILSFVWKRSWPSPSCTFVPVASDKLRMIEPP